MIHFDMQSPHGSRVYPTMTGIRLEIPDNMREAVGKWLRSEADRFDLQAIPPQDMVVCPACGGKLKLLHGVPVVCTLCHGSMRVSKAAAEGYAKSLGQPQTIVRQQTAPDAAVEESEPPPPFQDRYQDLRNVINQQQHPVAVPLQHHPFAASVPAGQPLIVDGKALKVGESIASTQVEPEEDEEFIGPIQQSPA